MVTGSQGFRGYGNGLCARMVRLQTATSAVQHAQLHASSHMQRGSGAFYAQRGLVHCSSYSTCTSTLLLLNKSERRKRSRRVVALDTCGVRVLHRLMAYDLHRSTLDFAYRATKHLKNQRMRTLRTRYPVQYMHRLVVVVQYAKTYSVLWRATFAFEPLRHYI